MHDSICYGRLKKVHFIGIGGIGMSGIAEVLLGLGLKVQGSDAADSDTAKRLRLLGAQVYVGHNEAQLGDADVVVVSSAIPADNPEVMAAHQKEIPVIPRAQMLAELMRVKHGIAIAGSHGKTTTTSLVASILQHADLDPTVVIGGRVNALGSNAKLGKGPFLVAEADESDGSFLQLSPCIAAITNMDPEHLDYFLGGIEEIKGQFIDFAHRIPFFGLVVLCADDQHCQEILPRLARRHVTYALDAPADFKAINIKADGLTTHFTVVHHNQEYAQVSLPLVGRHNVLNALCSLAIAQELSIPVERAVEALAQFGGVARRFSLMGEVGGVKVVDDYGHHPTEIKAVLAAARLTFPKARIRVLFQPHRYSRTQLLFNDFAQAFVDCDELKVLDIYAASETPLPGINSQSLALAIEQCSKTASEYAPSFDAGIDAVCHDAQEGDVVLTLGAGSVTKAAPLILQKLREGV